MTSINTKEAIPKAVSTNGVWRFLPPEQFGRSGT
jgi:hypothetical protein